MPSFFRVFIGLVFAVLLGVEAASAEASAPPRSPEELIRAVETRAGATDFTELERFGERAMTMPGREGFNRLYHVTWTFLNQGEFDRARLWNGRLAKAAKARNDHRYSVVARLNDMAIRYNVGDVNAATEIEAVAKSETDWFARAHATRLTALALVDQDRVGDGLKMLTEVDASIPLGDAYARTAQAGLWEVAGLGLLKLGDFDGAARAFGRFEIDFSNPDYPRPDFDSLYNLARLASRLGDIPLAERLAAAHHRLAVRSGLPSLLGYDANLCAAVAEARDSPEGVLNCLAPYGQDLGAASFMASRLLPVRAIAYARTGRIEEARRDIAEIRRREASGALREDGASALPQAEAELLLAEGRPAEGFAKLRVFHMAENFRSTQRFSAGMRQVTGDMQEELDDRRQQLEMAGANTRLQQAVIQSQTWIMAIAVIFVLSAIATLIWQIRLSRRLRAARLRADAANLSKSEFLANMSHEIRTPLNGIVAMADTLSRSKLGAREREMVDVIQASGVTLERLLSDILDTARIESGMVTIESAPFHLGDAVRGVGLLWGPRAEEKGVALTLDIDAALDQVVTGDAVRLRQILTNLISNALKFTSAGSVTVTGALIQPDVYRFTVTDTGVGFDDAQKGRIFGRFQQADGSITRRFGGTGLGLAISRDLVDLMGGTLDCDSRPGAGATFWFDLPLPPSEVASPVAAVDEAVIGDRALRILLADDHPANRKVVEIMLADTEAELVVVEDGQQAIDAFAGGGFDLILMDMQMPVMDGLTATTAIRSREAAEGLKPTPVVMLTANALAEHIDAGRAAGADGHLAKPITTATLFAAIETALARGDAAAGDQAA